MASQDRWGLMRKPQQTHKLVSRFMHDHLLWFFKMFMLCVYVYVVPLVVWQLNTLVCKRMFSQSILILLSTVALSSLL